MSISPLALTDDQVDACLGLELTALQRTRLRRSDAYPPFTIIANRRLVLRVDLDAWLLRQQERSALAVARRTARARKASTARWSRAAA
jgi:hypothetical protein